MDIVEPRYWPFKVLPLEERSEYAQRQIDFLETAYQAGYKPYMSGSEDFGVAAGERSGTMLYRGCRGKHWELLLGTAEETTLEAHVDDFQCAAEALLQWLRGIESAEILESLRGHLFVTLGCHFQASNERRHGEITGRSARGKDWEILLRTTESVSLSAHVNEFGKALDVLLQWLRGAGTPEILENIRSELVRTADCPDGYLLHEPEPVEVCQPASARETR